MQFVRFLCSRYSTDRLVTVRTADLWVISKQLITTAELPEKMVNMHRLGKRSDSRVFPRTTRFVAACLFETELPIPILKKCPPTKAPVTFSTNLRCIFQV